MPYPCTFLLSKSAKPLLRSGSSFTQQTLLNNEESLLDAVVYHCQQAAEINKIPQHVKNIGTAE
jgi:hypothetical protein